MVKLTLVWIYFFIGVGCHCVDVVAIVSRFLTQLGVQVPDTCVIVTSRTALKQTSCATFKVVPMSLLEGLELFVSRAQKVKPNFVLTENNRIGLAQLVTQLDCLPLAIELAAARVTMFTAEQIAERLAQRFDLLRGRVRDQETKNNLPYKRL